MLNNNMCNLDREGVAFALGFPQEAVSKFFYPNCTRDFEDAGCTSADPNTCPQQAVSPSASFRTFSSNHDDVVLDELAMRDPAARLVLKGGVERVVTNASTSTRFPTLSIPSGSESEVLLATGLPKSLFSERVDQYTLVGDFFFEVAERFPGESVEGVPTGGCERKLSRNEWEGRLHSKHPRRPSSCLIYNQEDRDADTYCPLLGVMGGCVGDDQFTAPLLCGAKFGVGHLPLVRGKGVPEFAVVDSILLAQHRIDAANDTGPDGMWMRIVLSVDLIAGFVRVYANAGEGSGKVMDDRWLQEFYSNEPLFSDDEMSTTFVSPGGVLALGESVRIASDCNSASKLGSLTLFPAAMEDRELKVLAGDPFSPSTFMLEVLGSRVREITEDADGQQANITVRLLHPPSAGFLNIALRAVTEGSDGRIEIFPSRLTFTRDSWRGTQHFGIRAVDDAVVQRKALETFVLRVIPSERTLWPFDQDDLVHLAVRDNDVAFLRAEFAIVNLQDAKSIYNNSSGNATIAAGTPDAAKAGKKFISHAFTPVEWCRKGYTCAETATGTDGDSSSNFIVSISESESVQYTLVLGSKPDTAHVKISMQISTQNAGANAPSVFEVTPSEIIFTNTTWRDPQPVTLTYSGEPTDHRSQHVLEHVVQSNDEVYNSLGVGLLSVTIIPVPSPANKPESDSGLPAWTAAVFIVVALLLFAAVLLIRRRASAKVAEVIRQKSNIRKEYLKEKQELERTNAKMAHKLQNAEKLVKKVMKEGGTAMDAFELRAADINYDDPREALGEGSFGTVYVATFQSHRVAVKTMRVTKINERELDKFKAEIVIMAPLRHPNIVHLYGGVWNEGADNLCLVLEYCAKGSLIRFLQNGSPRRHTWNKDLGGFALGIAQGLSYLHRGFKEPLIHRDIKPANILISSDNVAKLADFGECTRFDKAEARRNSNAMNDVATMSIVGTRMYCAPEVLMGQKYNEAADTFSFSLILLCFLVGDINYVQKQYKKYGRDYFLEWRPHIPEELTESEASVTELIESMWQTDFRERPSMKNIVEVLSAATLKSSAFAGSGLRGAKGRGPSMPTTSAAVRAEGSGAAAVSSSAIGAVERVASEPAAVPSDIFEEKRERAKARYRKLSREEVDVRLLDAEASRDELTRRLCDAEALIAELRQSNPELVRPRRPTISSERGISLSVTFEYDPDLERSVVGEGAFGKVYAVKSTLDGKSYAMKRLSALMDGSGNVDSGAMFELLAEVQKLSHVRSDFFVQYVTSSIAQQHLFVVMERLHGVQFRDLVVKRKTLGTPFLEHQIERWMEQLSAGLAYLHDDVKLVHQDLHNGNVMITWEPNIGAAQPALAAADDELLSSATRVKILDLGLASFKSEHTTRTNIGSRSARRMSAALASRRGSYVAVLSSEVCGFKAIRAPEMWSPGEDDLVRFDAKADMWALGLLISEAVLCTPIEEWYEKRETLLSFGKAPELQDAKIEEVSLISPYLGGLVGQMLEREPRFRLAAREVLQEIAAKDTLIFPPVSKEFFCRAFTEHDWLAALGHTDVGFVAWRQSQMRGVLETFADQGPSWKALSHASIPSNVRCEWKTTKGTNARLYRIAVPLECTDAGLAWVASVRSAGTAKFFACGDRAITKYRILQVFDDTSSPSSLTRTSTFSSWLTWELLQMPRPMPKRYYYSITHTDENALLVANFPADEGCKYLVERSVDLQLLDGAVPGKLLHSSFKFEVDTAGVVHLHYLIQTDLAVGESAYHGIMRRAKESVGVDRAGVEFVKGCRGVAQRVDMLADLLRREQQLKDARSFISAADTRSFHVRNADTRSFQHVRNADTRSFQHVRKTDTETFQRLKNTDTRSFQPAKRTRQISVMNALNRRNQKLEHAGARRGGPDIVNALNRRNQKLQKNTGGTAP